MHDGLDVVSHSKVYDDKVGGTAAEVSSLVFVLQAAPGRRMVRDFTSRSLRRPSDRISISSHLNISINPF